MAEQQVSGWYPDPSNGAVLRFWDGAAWTDHVATPSGPGAPAAVAAPATDATVPAPEEEPSDRSPNRRRGLLVAAGLVALVVIASVAAGVVASGGSVGTLATGPDRRQVEQEYEAAVAAGCEAIKAALSPTNLNPLTVPVWNERYRSVLGKTRAEMNEASSACAAPAIEAARKAKADADAAEAQRKAAAAAEAAKQKAEAEAAAAAAAAAEVERAIANAGPVDVDRVVKDPEAVKGQVFKVVALITQYDSATGPCAFRAYWDRSEQEYNFEYAGDNGIFTAGSSDAAVATAADCPVLGGVDKDDVVTIVVRGLGSVTYSNTFGGSMSAPKFEVLRVDGVRKK